MRKIILVSLGVSMVVAAAARGASTATVLTGSATNLTNGGAQLHGAVNPQGTSTDYKFEYGLTSAYGAVSGTGHAGRGTKAIAVQADVAGLNPGTVYHYRIDATNKLGVALGTDHTFMTTGHPLPAAITGAAMSVGRTTVTLTGTVVTQGQTTTFVFEYGTTATYGLQTNATDATASTASTGVSYAVTGLSPGTTFHYRLVAQHAGTPPEYGADQTFTTIPLVRLRARLTAHTTPVHARHKPYVFTTTGTVATPPSLPASAGCSGVVIVRFLRGHRSVAFRNVPLQANCTFSAQVPFRHLVGHGKTGLRVAVRFRGNAYVRQTVARTQRIRLG